MNRHLASTLTVTTTAAAILAVAAIASGNAYADDITIDNTPFVGSRTRADVRAEVTGQSAGPSNSSSEWAMQMNQPARLDSGYTSDAAKAEYIAARDEVKALNAEDSGSSYFATLPRRMSDRVMTARETVR